MVREARRATVCGVTRVGHVLATKPPQTTEKVKHCRITYTDAVIKHFKKIEFLNVQIYIKRN